MSEKEAPSQDLMIRLSTNYRLPAAITRARWRVAKSKATSDGYTNYQRALEIFHDLRNMRIDRKARSKSALPIARRRAQLREMTRSALPISRRRSSPGTSKNT